MNIVFKKGSSVPLKPGELAEEANAITQNKPFTVFDFMGPKSRIAGSGHCACGGHGVWRVLPSLIDNLHLLPPPAWLGEGVFQQKFTICN